MIFFLCYSFQAESTNFVFKPIICEEVSSRLLQKIHIDSHDDIINEINIDLYGTNKRTYLYVLEEGSYYFERTRTAIYNTNFKLKKEFQNKEITFDFVLRSIFYNVTINITVEHQKKYKGYAEHNYSTDLETHIFINVSTFAIIFFFFIALCLHIDINIFIIAFFILWFSLSEVVCPNEPFVQVLDGLIIEHIPYYFPKQTSYFNTSYVDEIVEYFKDPKPYDSEKCISCDFQHVTTDSNSSPRDIITTSVHGDVKNLEVFIRSARTSGCKATIVIFMDSDPTPQRRLFEGCGVIFVEVPKIISLHIVQVQSVRFKHISNFLSALPPGSVDRLLYADLYDTVFQGDPFLKNITSKDLIISTEDTLIRDNGWSMDHLLSLCYPLDIVGEEKWVIACSGVYIGGYEAFKAVSRSTACMLPYNMSDCFVTDQLYFTIVLYSHVLENSGFNIRTTPIGGFLTSCNMHPEYMEETVPTKNKHMDGPPPVVFHHMNRVKNYHKSVCKSCHVDYKDL